MIANFLNSYAQLIFPFNRSNFIAKPGIVHSKSLTQTQMKSKASKIRKEVKTPNSKYSMSNLNQNIVKVRNIKSLPSPDTNQQKVPKKFEKND